MFVITKVTLAYESGIKNKQVEIPIINNFIIYYYEKKITFLSSYIDDGCWSDGSDRHYSVTS